MGDESMKQMALKYPVYPDLDVLPQDKRFYACWYYYTLAQKVFEKIGNSTEDQFGLLETDLWLSPQYEQIARSVALLYGFNDPGPFMEERIWDVISSQALELGYPLPNDRYMRPLRIQLIGTT
jgi:hypothetical protein